MKKLLLALALLFCSALSAEAFRKGEVVVTLAPVDCYATATEDVDAAMERVAERKEAVDFYRRNGYRYDHYVYVIAREKLREAEKNLAAAKARLPWPSNRRLFSLDQNTECVVLLSRGDYCLVRAGGYEGWVAQNLLGSRKMDWIQ